MSQKITTPCIKVCSMERSTGWCLGCGRTGPEIARWWNLGEAGREAVLADLPRRLAAMGLPPGGDRDEGHRRAREQRIAAGDAIVSQAAISTTTEPAT